MFSALLDRLTLAAGSAAAILAICLIGFNGIRW